MVFDGQSFPNTLTGSLDLKKFLQNYLSGVNNGQTQHKRFRIIFALSQTATMDLNLGMTFLEVHDNASAVLICPLEVVSRFLVLIWSRSTLDTTPQIAVDRVVKPRLMPMSSNATNRDGSAMYPFQTQYAWHTRAFVDSNPFSCFLRTAVFTGLFITRYVSGAAKRFRLKDLWFPLSTLHQEIKPDIMWQSLMQHRTPQTHFYC